MPLMYAGNPRETADQVAGMEAAGLDTIWVAEPYGFDAPTLMGYLAAKTEKVEIGAAILNIYSRTPGALLQTAAGLDNVSGGRAIIGLGASGPQVIEGFHGVKYDKPVARTKEIIDIIRRGMRGERVTSEGLYQLPLPDGLGKPLKLLNKPERTAVPLYIAALGPKSVEGAAEYADGWLPFLFHPEKAHEVWGEPLATGTANRQEGLAPLEVCAGGMLAIGEGPETKASWTSPDRSTRCTSAAWARAARTSTTSSPAATATRKRPRRSRTSTSTGTSGTPRPRSHSSGSRPATSWARRRT